MRHREISTTEVSRYTVPWRSLVVPLDVVLYVSVRWLPVFLFTLLPMYFQSAFLRPCPIRSANMTWMN